jgi:hypothetical protein
VILDPWGRVQVRTERLERGWAVGRIRPRRDLTLYARVGDLFAALCAAALPVAFYLGRGAGGSVGGESRRPRRYAPPPDRSTHVHARRPRG